MIASSHFDRKAFGSEPGVEQNEVEKAPLTAAPQAHRHANPSTIRGQIVTPADINYDEARKDYNERLAIRPSYILYCEDENDVCQAVKWARDNQNPVSIRSGGHSYEGFSLIDGGAVIDVSKMTRISVDAAGKIAVVESGVKLMPLYEALWDKRLVIPGGSCATVGIAGLTLGGGFGLLARHMGLTCDNLLGLRIVDARGTVLEADKDSNPDLFWACRGGGGGNFGVITEFAFQLHPIGEVTMLRVRWNWHDMPAVIRAWQVWAPDADDRFTTVLTLTSAAANGLSCVGVFVGGQDQAEALIKPLFDATMPAKVSMSTVPFIEAARRFSGFRKAAPSTRDLRSPPEAVHLQAHPRFKNTSDFLSAELNESAIDTIVSFLADSPRDSSCLQFDSYGGAVNRVPIKDSAFCHRGQTKFCLHYQISWKDPAEDARNLKWVNDFRRAMQPFVSGFAYINYCDREIDNWAHCYYGENLERLIAIKRKYDPENFFRHGQSIVDQT